MKIAPADLPRILGSVLSEVDELLRRLAIPHALIGGLAVGIYTQARATKDVDLAVAADVETASRAVAAMRALGFEARAHGVPGPGAVVRFSRTGVDGFVRWVDFLFAGTPFEEQAVARARVAHMLGGAIAVATVEDLLVYKLIAGRPQDVADAVALVRERGSELDRGHLEAACDAWELRSELARIEALATQAGWAASALRVRGVPCCGHHALEHARAVRPGQLVAVEAEEELAASERRRVRAPPRSVDRRPPPPEAGERPCVDPDSTRSARPPSSRSSSSSGAGPRTEARTPGSTRAQA